MENKKKKKLKMLEGDQQREKYGAMRKRRNYQNDVDAVFIMTTIDCHVKANKKSPGQPSSNLRHWWMGHFITLCYKESYTLR